MIAWSIWATAVACSLDADAILLIISTICSTAATISSNAWAVSVARAEPCSTLRIESSIISAVSLAAEALFPARFLTSSATTAKPLP